MISNLIEVKFSNLYFWNLNSNSTGYLCVILKFFPFLSNVKSLMYVIESMDYISSPVWLKVEYMRAESSPLHLFSFII